MPSPCPDPALDNYRAIADAIATLFFPHAEVVLHDLRSQKIDYIANNLSKREIGDDAALEDLLEPGTDDINIGPYEKLNWDGQKIRSLSTVLRDSAGKPLAVLCLGPVEAFYPAPMLVLEGWAQARPLSELVYENYWGVSP